MQSLEPGSLAQRTTTTIIIIIIIIIGIITLEPLFKYSFVEKGMQTRQTDQNAKSTSKVFIKLEGHMMLCRQLP